MSDDFDPLRELRPDRVRPDDPGDPTVFSREKERLMSTIDQTRAPRPPSSAACPTSTRGSPTATSAAALDYLVRVFQFVENREARMEFDGRRHLLAGCASGDGVVMIGHANADVHLIHSPLETRRSPPCR